MPNMNDYMRRIHLPQDARSTRGILSRGRNVYKGGSNKAKGRSKQAALGRAALNRLRGM